MKFLSIYGTYLKLFFKARVEHRSNFFAGIISNFYSYLITYLTFWVIVKQFGSINGWSFEEMCILYGFNLLTYAISSMIFWSVMGLEKEVTKGNLDVLMIRPMGLIKQLVCKQFVDTFIGQVLIATIFMIQAFSQIHIVLTVPKLLYLFLSLFGSVLIHSGAMIFFGALSFWIERSLPVADLLYWNLQMFTQYPISIFPKLIQFTLTFIFPWAFINYYPTLIILTKYSSNYNLFLGLIAPFVGVAFFLLSLFVFYRGLHRYSGSGS